MSDKIAKALMDVMRKVSYVQRTGKNSFHNYTYAGETDLLDKLRPAMMEAGLMLLPSVQHVSPIDDFGNTHVQVAYTLIHQDGDIWPEKLVAAGTGNDKAKNGTVGDKGVYKAITGANKYLLFKLFQIATGDEPEQASAHDETSSETHVPKPRRQSGAAPVGNDVPSVAEYVERALRAIEMTETRQGLIEWWSANAEMRKALGITGNSPEYATLRGAWEKRGKSLVDATIIDRTNLMAAG